MKRAARVRTRLAVTLVAGALFMSGCASPPPGEDAEPAAERGRYQFGPVGDRPSGGEPVNGGTLSVAEYSEARSLDPSKTVFNGASGGNILAAVYDTLLRYDTEQDKHVPWIAQSLTSSEDHKTWTLTLRDGVKFSDGTALDAAAVVGSIGYYLGNGGSDAGLLGSQLKRMEPRGTSTVVFHLKNSWVLFPSMLEQGAGLIVAPAAIAGEKFKPIGAGPFTFESYAPQEEMVLTANKGYWKDAPHLDKLRFYWPLDDSARHDALKSEAADVTYLRDPQIVDEAVKSGRPGHLELISVGNVVHINNAKGRPGADIRVRRALALALDPVLDFERTFGGKGLPGKAIFPPEAKWHSSVEPLPVDIEKARKLLEEAKADGYDGTITYLDGSDPTSRAEAVVTKSMLERVGFKVKFDLVASVADQVKKIYVDRDFDLVRGGASVSDRDPFQRLYNQFGSASSLNASGYKNPEMDRLLAQLQAASGTEATQKSLDAIQTLWNKDVPAVSMGASAVLTTWQKNVHGVVHGAEQTVQFESAWKAQ